MSIVRYNQDKESKSNKLAMVLVLYIYMPYFMNIIKNTFHAPAILDYVVYLILSWVTLLVTQKINRKVLAFMATLFVAIVVNCILVPYKYYVLLEGLQAFVRVAVPCISIINNHMNLNIFLNKWWLFQKVNLPLVILAVILLKNGLVHYSVFTGICVPNAFIFSYMIMCEKNCRKLEYINLIIIIIITAVLGGRMATVISAGMMVFAFTYSEKIEMWKKVILLIILFSLMILILNNLSFLLNWTVDRLNGYGLQSRSVQLLIYQLENNEIYFTQRDYIYTASIEFIKGKSGFPGGFGSALYITSGQYYYTHNIILQFGILFGLYGSIVIISVMLLRNSFVRKIAPKKCRILLYYMAGCYFVIGFTGSSMWIHYLSTIFIALFFFGYKELYQTIE